MHGCVDAWMFRSLAIPPQRHGAGPSEEDKRANRGSERAMDDDDVRRLLALPIRRISAFDIDKHRKDVGDILAAINKVEVRLMHLTFLAIP